MPTKFSKLSPKSAPWKNVNCAEVGNPFDFSPSTILYGLRFFIMSDNISFY